MSGRVIIGVVIFFLGVGVALVVTLIQKTRLNANLVTSRNNLRDVAFFAAHHANPNPKTDATKLPQEIPAATIVLPNVPPDNRLSWVIAVLPALDQSRHTTQELLKRFALAEPWNAESNQQVARTRLPVLLVPENTPLVRPDTPAITCYVGIAGLGADAATLTLVPGVPVPPRAGAFRYDAATPFDRIEDGLSQTLLIGETALEPGAWSRGGTATVRAFDDAKGVRPLIGAGGQFGGFFPRVANFALCDGSVRSFTPETTPDVLFRMATIAGEQGGIPVPD